MWDWRYSSTHFLNSALDGGEWSASCRGRFTPRERYPGTHWIGDWVIPRAVLDMVMKGKIPNPRRESNPRTPIVKPVVQRYTDWADKTENNFRGRVLSLLQNIPIFGWRDWDKPREARHSPCIGRSSYLLTCSAWICSYELIVRCLTSTLPHVKETPF
jgi:hypothetical protein